MKKIILTSLGLIFVAQAYCATPFVVSMDKRLVFEQSKEGKDFISEYEKRKQQAEAELQKMEKDIQAEGQRLQKQAQMLSRDAFSKRQRDLAKRFRALEREKEERQQDLKMDFEEGYRKVMHQQYQAADKVRTKKGALLLVDLNEPGVVSVAPETNITEDVVKYVDADYEERRAGVSKGS